MTTNGASWSDSRRTSSTRADRNGRWHSRRRTLISETSDAHTRMPTPRASRTTLPFAPRRGRRGRTAASGWRSPISGAGRRRLRKGNAPSRCCRSPAMHVWAWNTNMSWRGSTPSRGNPTSRSTPSTRCSVTRGSSLPRGCASTRHSRRCAGTLGLTDSRTPTVPTRRSDHPFVRGRVAQRQPSSPKNGIAANSGRSRSAISRAMPTVP